MTKITIDIPDETVREVERRIGKQVAKEVAEAAFKEWSDWLLARDRPISISEIETNRVISLYREVFSDDLPSAQHLSSKLQLPLARCRYIVQCLRYLQPQLLMQRWLKAIQDAFSRARQQGELYIMDVDLDCKEIVDQLLQQLADESDLAQLRGTKRGRAIRYELTPGYYQRFRDALDAAIEANSDGGQG